MMRFEFNSRLFASRIKRVMELHSVTGEQVKVRSGISHGSFHRMINGTSSNIENILSVAAALGIDYRDFITENGERVRDVIKV